MARVDLFGERPRRSRRVMMHAIDSGSFPDGKSADKFLCKRCGHESDWIYATVTELRRGVPCGHCNLQREDA